MPRSITWNEERAVYAAAVAHEAVQTGGYSALVVAVANRSDTLWRETISGSAATQANSIFNIASISKPITASALMQLVERGRLVLRDPVVDYIPEFGQNGKERVSVWHLATHTSGVHEPDGEQFEALLQQRVPLATYLDFAYHAGLRFQPGSQWAYTQITYSILGEIISRVSGQAHPDFMREQLFTPLGMLDTGFVPADQARLFPRSWDPQTPEMQAYLHSLAFPAFGLYSTADDLLALGQTLLNNGKRGTMRVLSEGAVETMTRVHTEGIVSIEEGLPSPTFQGLGWGLRSPYGNVIGSARGYGHAGAGGSYLWIDPEWELVFVLLGNSPAPQPNLPIKLLNAVYGALERS